MKRLILIISFCLSLEGCTHIEFNEKPVTGENIELCFKGYVADIQTKTERQENTDVYWCPGDAISIFYNKGDNGGNRFVAQNKTVSQIAEFKGTITEPTGGESTGGEFWGVYPYSEENSCDGSTITLTLPERQTAKVGSFENGLFPTIARSKGLELGFYNICGGFKFSVSRDDITAVKFRGNSNEYLAGGARVGWDTSGHPAVIEHLDGKTDITVNAPNGGTFEAGENYYIVFFPELLSKGFTMTFYTSGNKEGYFVYNQSRQSKEAVSSMLQI